MHKGSLLSAIALLLSIMLDVQGCDRTSSAIVVIALHPRNPSILYVATNDYIYKSRDEGATWENISAGMSHSRVIALAIDPAYPAIVYAGTKGDAVYKSFDGGQRWSPRKTGLDDVTITSVVNQLLIDPRNHEHLFAATTMGVFETEDAGDTWKKRMQGMKEVLMVVSLATDPARPDILYAGTSGGVYKSRDRARTWAKANQGLIPASTLSSSRALMVNTVLVDPQHPEVVYAATLSGLYKSTDAAGTWVRIGASLPDQMLSTIALDPSQPDTVYVTSRQGLYKSRDAGATWVAKNAGLGSLNLRTVALNPQEPATVYLGSNSGLYRSRNGGETWEPLPLTTHGREARS